ncbi:unnamed protein product (macronuclear) [Paramecium tetraurelia]|uniref:CHAT domain-containing protein n=1 Tax=Paramecium tetraurelia TaxID=5888 RepID=A0CBA6_PARTE|nr:uncharacterized protein GSPATT00036856001 [Paramecium tetraurelia]CAK68073.1 unnamed protein product [Paramecium tetraurelia]|eukprot:XP_001435470.1 hypothetical protein (macronuclear) [Paramecium tetraurelia strain d4-2]
MKTPFCVRLQILGIQPNDEVEYFENPDAFENSQKVFPLNNNGQIYGIYVRRLEYYIKKNYVQEGKIVKGRLIYTFYNYITQQFVDIFDLLCMENTFIKLDGQFWFKDENALQPLIIRLRVQIHYQEYQRFQHFLENIELEKKNLYNSIEKAKAELTINYDNLNNFKMRVNQLKQCYQIQPQYPEIDIAILYSHPLVNQNQKRVNPVQYYDDISNFKKRISALNKKVTYLITQATKENLRWVLKYNPKIIHIIAHGENDTNQLNQYLQFENNCTDDFVYREDLQLIMKDSKKSLVFLACCYAGEIAKNIQQYATTIAVDKELKMLDDAGILYFSSLYENLLEKKTLQESHEEAKKKVEVELGEKNYQCCHSHSHRQTCKDVFGKTNDLCFGDKTQCECKKKSANLIKDRLSHLWGPDPKDQCKEVCEVILQQIKDQSQRELVKMKLDEFAEDGVLRVCCCELAEKLMDDSFTFIQHTESEKFQIFSQSSSQSQIFNQVEDGNLIELNQLSWEEQYFIAWKRDAKTIFHKLSEIFYTNKRQILKICAGHSKGEMHVVKFAHQVSKYFKFRKLKFYKRNEIDDIQIIQDPIENIQQLLKRSYEARMSYIFIIHKINKELFLKSKDQLAQLNQKGTVILISNSELIELELDSNYYKIMLKDWENLSEKKEKCDFFKIINEYGEEIRDKILEELGENNLKKLKYNDLLDEIENFLNKQQEQIVQN